jgi:aspartyl-tRNA(Asn)/glutamyl-tRNA(Gln) amidotransferase subunit A
LSLLDLSILDLGPRLRNGTLSSAALTQAHLDRVAATDPALHAFALLMAEKALAAAARADADLAAGVDRGPLHGIPIALKDLIDVKGVPTGCGSGARANRVAAADAEVTGRLKAAGAVILGKLATYEFGLVGPSFDLPALPAVNPWKPDHVTGGSSSGSAAAVAARLVRTTVGTDTGGSIRSPAAYCGVAGLKPTFGRVAQGGVFPLSSSLDHVGSISATVAEAAITLDAIADPPRAGEAGPAAGVMPAARLLGEGIETMRIAYARAWFARDPALMPEVLSAMDDAVSQLSLLGARIAEVALPDYELMEAVGAVILHREALAVHRSLLRERGRDYGRRAYRSLVGGLCLTELDLARALRAAARLRDAIDAAIFSRHDALVTACTLTTAPPVMAFEGESPVWTPMRTLPFNVTGHPALALPIGFAGGLPIGMQIVGKANEEAQICRVGAAFERSTDHSALRPVPLRGVDQTT